MKSRKTIRTRIKPSDEAYPPKTLWWNMIEFKRVDVPLDYMPSLAEETVERLIKDSGPHYAVFEFPDREHMEISCFPIYRCKGKLDPTIRYFTDWTVQIIRSYERVKDHIKRRNVILSKIETEKREEQVSKLLKDLFTLCMEETEELINFHTLMLKDGLLRLVRKGKVGMLTKDEMIAEVKKLADKTETANKSLLGNKNGILSRLRDKKTGIADITMKVNNDLSVYEMEFFNNFDEMYTIERGKEMLLFNKKRFLRNS